MSTESIAWIAADWGTSNLRCWAMSADHRVIDRAESNCGMQAVTTSGGDFETALLDLIHPWLRHGGTLPVSACGMVGAKQGWIEAPYVSAPCSPSTPTHRAATRSSQISVSIHAGVMQSHPADVMRGEETQIAGLLALQPDFEGLVCLPGTHTKWVTITDGRIQSFQTFMTGEAFALLTQHSVLRLTLATEGWDEAAYLEGLHSSIDSPANLLSHTFRLRAESLLNGLDSTAARSRLSGLLIGHELSAIRPTHHVILIGAESLTRPYQTALQTLDTKATVLDSDSATLAGLSASRS